mgnify:CR=1 FL=1
MCWRAIKATFYIYRCNVVINFFENAHKVSVSEEACDCGANLLEVDFSKVRMKQEPITDLTQITVLHTNLIQ